MPTKFSAFDAAEYLDSEAAIAAYLNEVVAEEDSDLLLSALEDVARARGMSKVADEAGLTRPGLYKALKPGSKTGFATVRKLVGALGLQVQFVPRDDSRLGRAVSVENMSRKAASSKSKAGSAPASTKARA